MARKKSYCAGRVKKDSLNKAAKAYVDDAVKKGKTKSEAQKIANKVVKGSCSVAVGSTKKRKTTKKSTSKKRKTRRRA